MRAEVRPSVAVHGLFVVFGFVVAAFFPFLAIYLDGRGLSADQIGIVVATMAGARMLFLPFWGHFADTTIGRVAALRAGTIGAAAGALAMNLVHGVWPLAAVGFVISAFMVATGPNIDAIALVHLGEERMSDYGRIRGWESLSYSGACLVFGAMLQAAGVRWAMPVYAIASLAVLAWTGTIPRDRPTDVKVEGRLGAVGQVFREAPRFWGFLAASLVLWTGFSGAWNFFSLKIEHAGGGPWLVGIGTALGGAVELPVMRLSTRLQRRFGLRVAFVTGCCIYAFGFFLWGQVNSPTLVSLLAVFEGMGFSLLFTSTIVIIGKLLPQTLYSTGNSVSGMVGFGFAPMLGGLAGGYVFSHLGSTVLFTGASACALLGGVIAWLTLDLPALAVAEPIPAVVASVDPQPGIVP